MRIDSQRETLEVEGSDLSNSSFHDTNLDGMSIDGIAVAALIAACKAKP